MTTNGFSSGDYDLTPSSMKYKTLDEDVAPTNIQQPQTEMKHPNKKCGGTPCTLKEWLFIGLVFILIVLVLAFGIASNHPQTTSRGGLSPQTGGVSGNLPKSCADALKQGITKSGIATIQPDKTMKPFEVYCEMTAAGGGWTMISSIHEDDISQKCGSGDMWSSSSRSSSNVPCVYCHYYYYGSQRPDPVNSGSFSSEGFQHWKNLVTFGEPSAATSADYKSKAYYSVPGSNMMIWHVPNDALLSTIEQAAFFKYYTDTNFLGQYGSTLQSLYSNYAPLVRLLPNGIQGQFLPCFYTNWAYYNQSSSSRPSRPRPPIRRPPNGPPSPPTPTTTVPAESSRKEEFFINVNGGEFVKIEHGKNINVSNQINVSMSNTGPRTILAWVGNEDKSIKSILFKMNRKYAWTSRSKYPNYFSNSDFSMQYQSTCTVGCTVSFVIGSSKLWDSRTPLNRFNSTQPYVSFLNLTNDMQRFMVGYTEFPRYGGVNPTSSTFRKMLAKLVGCFAGRQTHDLSRYPSISSKAKFIKGDMSDSIRNVTPGYIELRKYDSLGYPFALCPGIRVKDGSDPSLHCVGGVQTHYSLRNKCGDFAAWDQLIEHNKKRTPSGATDITSTLLLFVR